MVVMSEAVKMRQTSAGDQCEAVSSSTNSTPPMGAPNAAAIPAPAPAEINARRSRSLWKRPSSFGAKSTHAFRILSPRVTPDAMPAPMWMSGASTPDASDAALARMVVKILHTMVRSDRNPCPARPAALSPPPPAACAQCSRRHQRSSQPPAVSVRGAGRAGRRTVTCVPLRYALISAMPSAAEAGSKKAVTTAAMKTHPRFQAAKKGKESQKSPPASKSRCTTSLRRLSRRSLLTCTKRVTNATVTAMITTSTQR